MNRREFLGMAALLPAFGALSNQAMAAAATAQPVAGKAAAKERILVLVKLAGGNDGLNTLIPHQDQLYYDLRPSIALPRHRVLDIGEPMGLNPYLEAIRPWWERGNMAWVQGVGYPTNNLSHFRSSDIWDTGVAATEYSETGWLGRFLPECKAGLHGIVIGDDAGPMAGKDCNAITMKSPQTFLNQVRDLQDIEPVNITPALAHVTNVQHQLYDTGKQLTEKLQRPAPLGVKFSSSAVGRDLESVAKMILSGVGASVYMVTLDGFDTHTNQSRVQSNLLHHLGGALDSFAHAMQHAGRWDDVMVMTYSEFGRRVEENHGKGTDHGAASVQLVMGGKVNGGLYGDKPDLKQLDVDGNLPHTTDFRQVYSTVLQNWLGEKEHALKHYGTLPFV